MPESIPDHAELDLMRALESNNQLSQRELASSLGMSLGKANYCLRALIAKGFVKVQNYRRSTNKMAYLYLLTPEGVKAKAALTKKFIARKVEEYDALRVEIETLRRESGEFAALSDTP